MQRHCPGFVNLYVGSMRTRTSSRYDGVFVTSTSFRIRGFKAFIEASLQIRVFEAFYKGKFATNVYQITSSCELTCGGLLGTVYIHLWVWTLEIFKNYCWRELNLALYTNLYIFLPPNHSVNLSVTSLSRGHANLLCIVPSADIKVGCIIP